jgi:hypothetical protein
VGSPFTVSVSTKPTSRYSVRPISLFTLTARRACTVVRSSAPRPASSRTTGATNSWKVKNRRGGEAREHDHRASAGGREAIGLPGLSATPCATIARVRELGDYAI